MKQAMSAKLPNVVDHQNSLIWSEPQSCAQTWIITNVTSDLDKIKVPSSVGSTAGLQVAAQDTTATL